MDVPSVPTTAPPRVSRTASEVMALAAQPFARGAQLRDSLQDPFVGVPDQLERTARLIAAARGEDINAVVCAALRGYIGAGPL
jgi:hypothetical protein